MKFETITVIWGWALLIAVFANLINIVKLWDDVEQLDKRILSIETQIRKG